MILVSGFNVYPNEIEDVVMQHPKVREAAAIGVPSDLSGEAVKICIVKKIRADQRGADRSLPSSPDRLQGAEDCRIP